MNRDQPDNSYAIAMSDSKDLDKPFTKLEFPEYSCSENQYKSHYVGDITYGGFVKCIDAEEFIKMLGHSPASFIKFSDNFTVWSRIVVPAVNVCIDANGK